MSAKSRAGPADDFAASATMMSSEQEGKRLEAKLTHGDAVVGNPNGRDFAQSLGCQKSGGRLLLIRRSRGGGGGGGGERVEERIDDILPFRTGGIRG